MIGEWVIRWMYKQLTEQAVSELMGIFRGEQNAIRETAIHDSVPRSGHDGERKTISRKNGQD